MTIVEKTTKIPDEILVVKAQSGEADSVSELVVRYTPMITASAARMKGILELEDLVQEGMIGFLEAIDHYREGQGTKFRTYAGVCVQNRLKNALAKATSQKRRAPQRSVSLEEIGEIPQTDDDPQERFIRLEEYGRHRERARQLLTEREQKVLAGYLDGHSYEEIARTLSLTPKSVDNALQRAKRKLRSLR